MTIRRTIMTGAAAACWLCFTAHFAQAAPLRSFTVEQFNQVYKKFVGLDVRVIGRKTLFSKREIGLARCDVRFKSRRVLAELSKDEVNLQIDGRVTREGQRFVVYISAVTPLPSDTEEFQRRKRALRETSLDGWYELGDWAAGLATFYEDAEMSARARQAYEQAISIERATGDRDAQHLQALAGKAEKYGLPSSVEEDLVFEAFVWMRDRAKTAKDLEAAISSAATDLPGSETPLPQPQPKLRKSYEKEPLKTYESAAANQRKMLHRMLMTDLILARLQDQLDENFENGFQIADLIDREIPEFQDLAKEYRAKSLQMRTDQVATLSRTEILNLQKQYENQQQPNKGREVVEAWLEQRRNRLDEQDIEGLLNLADEYVAMLNRTERAAELLITAAERTPGNERIESRLQRLGYYLMDGRWVSERDRDRNDESEIARAMREGRPVRNMTATQLRKTMGEPVKILRIASQEQIDEFWLFGSSATSRLAVRLARRSGSPEAKVVAIGQVKLGK